MERLEVFREYLSVNMLDIFYGLDLTVLICTFLNRYLYNEHMSDPYLDMFLCLIALDLVD